MTKNESFTISDNGPPERKFEQVIEAAVLAAVWFTKVI
jgi:hypothetical protein